MKITDLIETDAASAETKSVSDENVEIDMNELKFAQKRQLADYLKTEIVGNIKYSRIKQEIRQCNDTSEIELIISDKYNQSTCVFGTAMQRAIELKQYRFVTKIFDKYLCNNDNNNNEQETSLIMTNKTKTARENEKFPENSTNSKYIDSVKFSLLFNALSKMSDCNPLQLQYYVTLLIKSNIESNVFIFHSILQAFRNNKELLSLHFDYIIKVWNFFTNELKIIPDIGCYNELLFIYGKTGNVKQAQKLWNLILKHNGLNDEMEIAIANGDNNDVSNDDINTSSLMDTEQMQLNASTNEKKNANIVEKKNKNTFKMDTILFGTMLNVYANNSMLSEMLKLFKTMKKLSDIKNSQIQVSTVHYNTLMKCYLHLNKPSKVLTIYKALQSQSSKNSKNSKNSMNKNTNTNRNNNRQNICEPDFLSISYKISAICQIIKSDSTDDPIKFVNKLKYEIPDERELLGLSRMDSNLCRNILECLSYLYYDNTDYNNTFHQWKHKVKPEFDEMIQYKKIEYLKRSEWNYGSLLIDLRRFDPYSALFVAWYILTYEKLTKIVSKQNDQIQFITGKIIKDEKGGLSHAHQRKVQTVQLLTKWLTTQTPKIPFSLSKDRGSILIDKHDAFIFQTRHSV